MALLEEAGYGGGFDGGDLNSASDNELAEFVQANLAAIGIKVTIRPSERAAFLQKVMDKQLTGLVLTGSGAPGQRGQPAAAVRRLGRGAVLHSRRRTGCRDRLAGVEP